MTGQLRMNQIFLEAIPVLERLKENGYEAYFVGGSVRDALLRKEIHDVDIATSAFPEEVKSLFPRTVDVGIEHGTVMVLFNGQSYEITTFRTESTYQDYRRPDSVTFVRSLEEDLKRRDFTINALAMDENGRIIDFFEGVKDLAHETIKAVGEPYERFSEDALRMMRAVRFQSQLDFRLEEKTFEAIKQHHHLLNKIAVERIQVEFVKMMLGKGHGNGIQSFVDSGLYRYCPGLRGQEQALDKMGNLAKQPGTTIQLWTLLAFYIGLSPEEVEPFMRKWKCSKTEMNAAESALKGLRERLTDPPSNRLVYQLGLNLSLETESMLELTGRTPRREEVKTLHENLPIYTRSELAVSGNDLLKSLGGKPGKWLGVLLQKLERAVVDGTLQNKKDDLVQASKKWMEKEEKNGYETF